MPTTLINVSNRLPVTIGAGKITKSSGGLVAALEGLSADKYRTQWIGWPGAAVEPAKQPEIARTLTGEHGCLPVFLTDEEAEAHYEGFANSSVWPLFHYMPNYLRYESRWWDAYQKVNRRFADKVLEIAHGGDLIWVHDYQLLLLPAMIKAARADLRVGFFLHTPFPSYEMFRCHPRRSELIAGMLGADLLGFHTFGYLRHFRSAALRLLGAESDITHVRAPDGHRAALGVYPIGINAKKFDETLDQPDQTKRQQKFRDTFQGKKLVISVERMDYTKGILHRIEAVDAFLAGWEDRDGIKFMFVSVPSREGVEDYQELRADVESRIGRLNGKYATLHNSPIHFIHDSVDFADLCALYSIADAALITPLIDGMNLVAKEYLACQRDHAGPLILSEFAGAAEELFNALLVNPYDAQSVAEHIKRALEMPPDERRERNAPMRERVMTYDAQRWAKSFIDDLVAPTPKTKADEETLDADDAAAKLAETIRVGKRVAMFLDYDGTLREFERHPDAARPTAEVRALFDALVAAPNVEVTIISGRKAEDLEAFVDNGRFGLIAEHGASLRPPGAKDWETQDAQVDYTWKDEVRPVLRLYEVAMPGSHIEEKRTSLVWHYRQADPEFGAWKANQLAEELGAMTANTPVQVRHGRKIVEIVSAQVSKGTAVARCLKKASYDLVLCAGDDATDESMFALDADNMLTVKIGEGNTAAKYRVPNPAAFRQFLGRALEPQKF